MDKKTKWKIILRPFPRKFEDLMKVCQEDCHLHHPNPSSHKCLTCHYYLKWLETPIEGVASGVKH